MKTLSDRERTAGTRPDMADLKGAWHVCVSDRTTNYWHRQRLNWEARYCAWSGQTSDGKKWPKAGTNRKVWPWPGAADSRVHLVDKYVREDVALLMQIWTEMRILVRPNSPAQDAVWANRMTSLLRWQMYEAMEEAEGEAEYLANLLLERGAAVLGVWWCREKTAVRERIELRAITEAAMQAEAKLAQGFDGDALRLQAQLPGIIADPTAEDEAMSLVRALTGGAGEGSGAGPGLDDAKVRAMLRDLREHREASFARPIVSKDRPVIRALAWNEDIWMPPTGGDLQKADKIFTREWLTESQVQERSQQLDWDAEASETRKGSKGYIEKMLDTTRGQVTELNNSPTNRLGGQWTALGLPDTANLYEIVTAYERLTDADGIPGIYVTTFCPAMADPEGYASSVLLDYAHGQYPFVLFQTERRSRLADDSRGYGEVASTWQNQIKKHWDGRTDRADLATLPPSHHPPGEEPDAWGPGVNIPTLQPDRFGYFEGPKWDLGAKEMEQTVRQFSDEYFGRLLPDGINKIEAAGLKRELSRRWMAGWKAVHKQVLRLDQQYMPDTFFFRVVGGEQGRGVKATLEDIQGEFNVTLKFNPSDLDPELVESKLKLIESVLAMDANGIVDRNETLTAALELIDPGYAERLLRPADAASMSEIKDEQDILAKLLLGIQVDVQGNEAFVLRRRALGAMIQNNPVAQNIIRTVPTVADNVERRIKQLDFNIQQKLVNPEIGRRLGTEPAGAAMQS